MAIPKKRKKSFIWFKTFITWLRQVTSDIQYICICASHLYSIGCCQFVDLNGSIWLVIVLTGIFFLLYLVFLFILLCCFGLLLVVEVDIRLVSLFLLSFVTFLLQHLTHFFTFHDWLYTVSGLLILTIFAELLIVQRKNMYGIYKLYVGQWTQKKNRHKISKV